MDAIQLVWFVVLGILGGVTNVIIGAESWEDLKKFSAFKRTIIGGIVGFLYRFLYSDYGFPNFVMTFVAGYMGTDFILAIIEKFKKKNNE